MVKGNDFIKKHQINILEVFGIFNITSHGRLTVSEIIIGEVSHNPPVKDGRVSKQGLL